MASTATATAAEETMAEWWLRFNNGVPADGAAGSSDVEAEEGEGAGGKPEVAALSGGREARGVAGGEEAGMGSGDWRAAAAASGVKKAEMVARDGGKVGAAGAGSNRRSSPRLADRAAPDEEIPGGNYVQPGELPRRKRKAIAKRSKLKVDGVEVQKDTSQGTKNSDGVEVQNDISQAQSSCPVLTGPERVYDEYENLRLQLALKTNELKQEENRRLKLELILKTKEFESLQKQNEELKAENEQLRKNAKPQRVPRLCRSCNTHVMHDYRNCPKRRRAHSSPEEEDGEEPY